MALTEIGIPERVFGEVARFQSDPVWHDLIPFHEYFHGDTGAGLGASHQTGWTGLVADLIVRRRRGKFTEALPDGLGDLAEHPRIDLTIEASFADQEFITCISKPAFWEGRCVVRGSVRGVAVDGLAYIERSGFEPEVE